jgi:peptidoglycan-associated lipoprotein
LACAHAKPAQPTIPDPTPVADTKPAPDLTDPAGSQQQQPAPPPLADHYGPIYFDFDAALVRDDARTTLQGLGDFLSQNPARRVTITGHTDERGTEEYNIALGDERAKSAKLYLVRLGVSAERVNTVSYGKGRPAVDGAGEDSWSKNRRDEFELSP